MKRFVFLLAFLLAACAPRSSQVALPEFLPTATAYIDPSYPTAQASITTQKQSTSGIEVRVDRAWQDGKSVNADVCFTLPDASDWSINTASLNYGETVLEQFGTTLLSLQEGGNGQPGLRCDTLTFVIPPDADLSNATIQVNSIGAYPRNDDYCSLLMPKIQQAMMERGTGILLDCVDVSGNGTLTMQITGKPPEMTQEQAEEIVYSDEFYTVKGPWSFPFSLTQ
jgi:hypothetical protein